MALGVDHRPRLGGRHGGDPEERVVRDVRDHQHFAAGDHLLEDGPLAGVALQFVDAHVRHHPALGSELDGQDHHRDAESLRGAKEDLAQQLVGLFLLRLRYRLRVDLGLPEDDYDKMLDNKKAGPAAGK